MKALTQNRRNDHHSFFFAKYIHTYIYIYFKTYRPCMGLVIRGCSFQFTQEIGFWGGLHRVFDTIERGSAFRLEQRKKRNRNDGARLEPKPSEIIALFLVNLRLLNPKTSKFDSFFFAKRFFFQAYWPCIMGLVIGCCTFQFTQK